MQIIILLFYVQLYYILIMHNNFAVFITKRNNLNIYTLRLAIVIAI